MMITGDFHHTGWRFFGCCLLFANLCLTRFDDTYRHTALGVAKQAGMVQPQSEIVIIDIIKPGSVRTELSVLSKVPGQPHAEHDWLPASVELSRQTSPPDLDSDLAKLASALSTRTSDLTSLRARLVNLERPDEQVEVPGLRFVSGENNQQLDQSRAVASLAEGRAQCAVTGAAFDILLQQQELSVLEVVMRNVVVFARMQPHQKGQVMDLVTMRGIHQMTPSGSRFIPVGFLLDCSAALSALTFAHCSA